MLGGVKLIMDQANPRQNRPEKFAGICRFYGLKSLTDLGN